MRNLLIFGMIIISALILCSTEWKEIPIVKYEDDVSITFSAGSFEEMNQEIISYAKANGLLSAPEVKGPTKIQKVGGTIIQKMQYHIENGSFDYISRKDLATYINHCHDANGAVDFPWLICSNAKYKTMRFKPLNSTSSGLLKLKR